MKIVYIFLILLILPTKVLALKLTKLNVDLSYPWGMTWVSSDKLLITEKKSHEIILIDTSNNTYQKIDHNLPIKGDRQGGLLDIISEDNNIWITGSIEKENGYTTAVFKSKLENNKLVDSQLIFEALPYIPNQVHFGSRMTIKGEHLYVSIGERGKGMIAQDPTNAIGSIIRINKDGSIPDDNPFVDKPDWLPAIYQIGVRNPQGMDLDPLTKKVFISNHGPKGGDEINIIKKGANYGWPLATFGIDYDGSIISKDTTIVGAEDPIYYWTPSIAPCGMNFYNSDIIPEWKGNLFLGALAGKHLNKITIENNKVIDEQRLFQGLGRFRQVIEGPEGYLYFVTESPGQLFRIKPSG